MLSKGTAERIYDILVKHAGANAHEDSRERFVTYQMDHDEAEEYRFCGKLGFGGKFRRSRFHGWYVNYYPEDTTKERDAMEKATNEALKALKESLPNEV